jgi:hypothetical protein
MIKGYCFLEFHNLRFRWNTLQRNVPEAANKQSSETNILANTLKYHYISNGLQKNISLN